MKPVAYTRIARLDPDLIARAARLSVADLHESLGVLAGRQALMQPQMRPIQLGRQVCGQAITSFNYPGDNLLLHVAAKLAQPGDVLVVGNGGSPMGALWGDVMTHFCQQRGIAGAVVDGAVRDIDRIGEMGFPLWSTWISVSHPEKRGPGAVNVPMVVAGVSVQPGDLVVADSDGVLAIPYLQVESAVAQAEIRLAKEDAIRTRIDAGETLFDILGLQKEVDAIGLIEIDSTWQESNG